MSEFSSYKEVQALVKNAKFKMVKKIGNILNHNFKFDQTLSIDNHLITR